MQDSIASNGSFVALSKTNRVALASIEGTNTLFYFYARFEYEAAVHIWLFISLFGTLARN
jgi:hypothetical protein